MCRSGVRVLQVSHPCLQRAHSVSNGNSSITHNYCIKLNRNRTLREVKAMTWLGGEGHFL